MLLTNNSYTEVRGGRTYLYTYLIKSWLIFTWDVLVKIDKFKEKDLIVTTNENFSSVIVNGKEYVPKKK